MTDDNNIDHRIETSEEYRKTKRTEAVLEARQKARNSFNRAIEVKRDHGRKMAQVFVHRSVTSYVEELSFHMRNTEKGKPYWEEKPLGTIELPPIQIEHEFPDGYSKEKTETYAFEPIDVIGIASYLGLPEVIEQQCTVEIYREYQGYQEEKRQVSIAVPIDISRVAYRLTNDFAEEMNLGLELEADRPPAEI